MAVAWGTGTARQAGGPCQFAGRVRVANPRGQLAHPLRKLVRPQRPVWAPYFEERGVPHQILRCQIVGLALRQHIEQPLAGGVLPQRPERSVGWQPLDLELRSVVSQQPEDGVHGPWDSGEPLRFAPELLEAGAHTRPAAARWERIRPQPHAGIGRLDDWALVVRGRRQRRRVVRQQAMPSRHQRPCQHRLAAAAVAQQQDGAVVHLDGSRAQHRHAA